jgi:hypothetical protein
MLTHHSLKEVEDESLSFNRSLWPKQEPVLSKVLSPLPLFGNGVFLLGP